MVNESGACGIYCELCPIFKREDKRCSGCEWVNQNLRKYRESHKGCVFWECAQQKGLKCCFQCKEFPCQSHYDQKDGVYSKQSLDNWKDLMNKGFAPFE